MNKDNLFVFLLSASPLASYFIGRFNRAAGLLAAAAILVFSGFALVVRDFGGVPFMVLVIWALAAIAHSLLLNSWASRPVSEEKKLQASKDRALKLQSELKTLTADFSAVALDEKKALVLYSAVKLLSEAVDLESAGKQFARYIKDYFETGEFTFYINDPNAPAPGLFAAGEKPELLSWERISRTAGKGPPNTRQTPVGGAGGQGLAELAWPFVIAEERIVAAPVRHAGETVGLFTLRFEQNAFNRDRVMAAAQKFADEVSFAVKRIQLFRQVEWLSQVDGLTGVYRRNALDEKISEEIRRADAFKTTLGFMIVDIDHFKKINDRYGHQFGDFVLKRVGALLRASVYETDFVGRYGGEEFAVVLPRADFAGVLRKAEAIRAKIEEENFAQGLETVKLTVSTGIAHFPRDGAGGRELIASADKALYKAKETGRNKVVDAGSV
ncbi:MAG: GGDEF domain-containing protein [Elusimicrobia bacterium]|nr:GGDEF domain-containing protein [Elusimicrobiota bacterium]